MGLALSSRGRLIENSNMPTACDARTRSVEWGHSEDCWGVLSCVQLEGQTTRQHDLKALLGNSSQGWMSQQALFHLADELGFYRDGEETKPRAGALAHMVS